MIMPDDMSIIWNYWTMTGARMFFPVVVLLPKPNQTDRPFHNVNHVFIVVYDDGVVRLSLVTY